MKPTQEQIEAFDLRRACFHEAAHAAVAAHFGARAEFVIRRVTDAGEWDRTWSGSCVTIGVLTPDQRKLVGLAGEVATQLLADEQDGNDFDAADVACTMAEYIEDRTIELSDSDRALAGDFNETDLEACVKLVRALWQTIAADSERMISFIGATPRDYPHYWSREPEALG